VRIVVCRCRNFPGLPKRGRQPESIIKNWPPSFPVQWHSDEWRKCEGGPLPPSLPTGREVHGRKKKKG